MDLTGKIFKKVRSEKKLRKIYDDFKNNASKLLAAISRYLAAGNYDNALKSLEKFEGLVKKVSNVLNEIRQEIQLLNNTQNLLKARIYHLRATGIEKLSQKAKSLETTLQEATKKIEAFKNYEETLSKVEAEEVQNILRSIKSVIIAVKKRNAEEAELGVMTLRQCIENLKTTIFKELELEAEVENLFERLKVAAAITSSMSNVEEVMGNFAKKFRKYLNELNDAIKLFKNAPFMQDAINISRQFDSELKNLESNLLNLESFSRLCNLCRQAFEKAKAQQQPTIKAMVTPLKDLCDMTEIKLKIMQVI
ncbi:MAG: hypothetical protein QW625_01575 [Candidatus Nanoarchaeia archaeon]